MTGVKIAQKFSLHWFQSTVESWDKSHRYNTKGVLTAEAYHTNVAILAYSFYQMATQLSNATTIPQKACPGTMSGYEEKVVLEMNFSLLHIIVQKLVLSIQVCRGVATPQTFGDLIQNNQFFYFFLIKNDLHA